MCISGFRYNPPFDLISRAAGTGRDEERRISRSNWGLIGSELIACMCARRGSGDNP